MRPQVYSSGFLVFRFKQELEFLLMKHPRRWDLPKGHLDKHETKKQAALRELEEETGISVSCLWIDPIFEYTSQYCVQYDSTKKLKELTIYLALAKTDIEIRPTEHSDYAWFAWSPPHKIQAETIDPLLAQVADHFEKQKAWPYE